MLRQSEERSKVGGREGGWRGMGGQGAVCINEWQINVEHVWIEHGAGGRSQAGQEQSTRQTTMANGGCSQRRRSFKIFLHSSHTYRRHTYTHTHLRRVRQS